MEEDTTPSHLLLCPTQRSTYVQAGMVGEDSVVTQRHVLLLPLFVERLATAFEENALKKKCQETQTLLGPGTSRSATALPLVGDWSLKGHKDQDSRNHPLG